MNWVIPGHVMALSSPVTPHLFKGEGAKPQKVLEAFKKEKITKIIRLNEQLYNESVFTDSGIDVEDLEFPDGSCPSLEIVSSFINLCK